LFCGGVDGIGGEGFELALAWQGGFRRARVGRKNKKEIEAPKCRAKSQYSFVSGLSA